MNLSRSTNRDPKGASFFHEGTELVKSLVSVTDSGENHGKIYSRDDGCVGMPEELFGDVCRRGSNDVGENECRVSLRKIHGKFCAYRIGNGNWIGVRRNVDGGKTF